MKFRTQEGYFIAIFIASFSRQFFPLIIFLFFLSFPLLSTSLPLPQVVPSNQNVASLQSPTHTPLPQTSAQVCCRHRASALWSQSPVPAATNLRLLANDWSGFAYSKVSWRHLTSSGCIWWMAFLSSPIHRGATVGSSKVEMLLISVKNNNRWNNNSPVDTGKIITYKKQWKANLKWQDKCFLPCEMGEIGP